MSTTLGGTTLPNPAAGVEGCSRESVGEGGLLELALLEVLPARHSRDHDAVLTQGQIVRNLALRSLFVDREFLGLRSHRSSRNLHQALFSVISLEETECSLSNELPRIRQVVHRLGKIDRSSSLLSHNGLRSHISSIETTLRI